MPPIVDEVLRSSGQPLDAASRAYFEPRFGHDFSRVRVHTDRRSSESAAAVNALAYTVGSDIVMGAGQYHPHTGAGQRLLAHELTHVVQQDGVAASLQPQSISIPTDAPEQEADTVAAKVEQGINVADLTSLTIQKVQRAVGDEDALFPRPRNMTREERTRKPFSSTLPYREATELIECVRIMGEPNSAYCRQQVLGEPLPLPPMPDICVPSQSLTWADFTAQPPHSQFSAETHFHHSLDTYLGGPIIRAFFEPSNSWVKSRVANPTNTALNGCAAKTSSCEQHFDSEVAAGRPNGITWFLDPPTNCPAAAIDPRFTVTSRGDCSQLIEPECTRRAAQESARVLHHEQLHFDIACVLANKGTATLRGNPSLQGQTVLNAVRTKARQLSSSTGRYDTATHHGCDAAAQAGWESDVQAGLPQVNIP